MKLLSLQTGPVVGSTAIVKEPVEPPIAVGSLGLEGDEQADPRYHGGPDQAVYLYSAEDYAWWSEQLGRELPPGMFGENLTVDRFPEVVRIGDRLRIGEIELEITGPRIPCSKLAARMEDPRFVKRFAQADRPGYYARVLSPGTLQPGTVEWQSSSHLTGLEVYRMLLGKSTPEQRQQALAAPLAERLRAALGEGKD